MLRHIQGSLSASGTLSKHPVAGYKWKLRYIALSMTASSTTGTRSLQVGLSPYKIAGGAVYSLANTGNQTGVSSTYFSWAVPVVQVGSTNSAFFVIDSSMEIDTDTNLAIISTFISGDTGTYDILVDEEIDA